MSLFDDFLHTTYFVEIIIPCHRVQTIHYRHLWKYDFCWVVFASATPFDDPEFLGSVTQLLPTKPTARSEWMVREGWDVGADPGTGIALFVTNYTSGADLDEEGSESGVKVGNGDNLERVVNLFGGCSEIRFDIDVARLCKIRFVYAYILFLVYCEM